MSGHSFSPPMSYFTSPFSLFERATMALVYKTLNYPNLEVLGVISYSLKLDRF